jgi:hypothetical protein
VLLRLLLIECVFAKDGLAGCEIRSQVRRLSRFAADAWRREKRGRYGFEEKFQQIFPRPVRLGWQLNGETTGALPCPWLHHGLIDVPAMKPGNLSPDQRCASATASVAR